MGLSFSWGTRPSPGPLRECGGGFGHQLPVTPMPGPVGPTWKSHPSSLELSARVAETQLGALEAAEPPHEPPTPCTHQPQKELSPPYT